MIDYNINSTGTLSYSEQALKTAKPLGTRQLEIFHATLGIADEAGEISGAVKGSFIYGKPEDKINLVEEAGDLIWFINLLAKQIDVPLHVILEANLAKLGTRYLDGYSDAEGKDRKKQMERDSIERILTKHGIEI